MAGFTVTLAVAESGFTNYCGWVCIYFFFSPFVFVFFSFLFLIVGIDLHLLRQNMLPCAKAEPNAVMVGSAAFAIAGPAAT